MKYFSNPEPFGLPRGTIRAIIVLLFGIAIVFPIFKFAAYHEDIPQTVKEVMLVLVGGLQAIVNKYFELREKETAKKGVAIEGEPKPPEEGDGHA